GDDTDARGDMHFVLVNFMGNAQRIEDFVGAYRRVPPVRHFGEQDHEFVSPLATDRVRLAYAAEYALRNGLQQPIADHMTQGVVDMLKAIHIQIEYRQLALVTLGEGERLSEPIIQQRS